jgi:hypothetical protein
MSIRNEEIVILGKSHFSNISLSIFFAFIDLISCNTPIFLDYRSDHDV